MVIKTQRCVYIKMQGIRLFHKENNDGIKHINRHSFVILETHHNNYNFAILIG
jgi:hypothetical protein